ncbi:MAG: hypothetical protein IJP29_08560 [Lachnospiraceae bacterium]|nr:hypothetical protein [Lachnospiraceae bacterium]
MVFTSSILYRPLAWLVYSSEGKASNACEPFRELKKVSYCSPALLFFELPLNSAKAAVKDVPE